MPTSKVLCLQCPTLVSKSNITHLCRPCYLLSLRLLSHARASGCLEAPHSPPSRVSRPLDSKIPSKIPSSCPSVRIPSIQAKIHPPRPRSGLPIPHRHSKMPSQTYTPDPRRSDVIQPRRYSHHSNFLDQLPHDLLVYTSTYLQLNMDSYLIDPHFANLVKTAYADLGQLICITSRVFPLSDKTYTLVCKMQNSVNQIRCIFDSYVCGVEEARLKKPPTQYYYGPDPDPDVDSTLPRLRLGWNRGWSRMDYTSMARTGRKKTRTIPEEMKPQIVEAIAGLQRMNRIIVGFKKGEVEKLSKSSTKGIVKIFPKYVKNCQEWFGRIQPYLHSSYTVEEKQNPLGEEPGGCQSGVSAVKIRITPATHRPIREYTVDEIFAIDAPYILEMLGLPADPSMPKLPRPEGWPPLPAFPLLPTPRIYLSRPPGRTAKADGLGPSPSQPPTSFSSPPKINITPSLPTQVPLSLAIENSLIYSYTADEAFAIDGPDIVDMARRLFGLGPDLNPMPRIPRPKGWPSLPRMQMPST